MSAEHTPPGGLGKRLLAAAQQDHSWLVRFYGDTERRLTTAQVVDAYNDQQIDPDTYVWTEGMASWEQLQAVDALVDALHAEAARLAGETGSADPLPRGPAGSNGSAQSEHSLVFSLATLVQDHSAPATSARAGDDSGLIDLAALSASSGAAPARQSPAAPSPDLLFGGGLFPEAIAKPVIPAATAAPPAPRSQRGLIVALSAAAVLLAGLLVFQIVRSQGTTAPQPGSLVSASASSDTLAAGRAAPAAAPSSAAPVTPDGTPGDPADSAVALGETKPGPVAGLPTARPRPTAVKPPPDAPPPATSGRRATGACPCEEHDLMCQMRCAAKP